MPIGTSRPRTSAGAFSLWVGLLSEFGRFRKINRNQSLTAITGGWGGIRTHETVSRLPVFKTGAFNHSATHPASDFNRLADFPDRRNPVPGSIGRARSLPPGCNSAGDTIDDGRPVCFALARWGPAGVIRQRIDGPVGTARMGGWNRGPVRTRRSRPRAPRLDIDGTLPQLGRIFGRPTLNRSSASGGSMGFAAALAARFTAL